MFLRDIWSSPMVIDSRSAMQVISLLGMKLAVAESRVCLIRCKSPKELGQEDKSPLLSLLQQQLVSLRYFKRGGRCNGCGMGCALEALQAFLSYSLESASTEGGITTLPLIFPYLHKRHTSFSRLTPSMMVSGQVAISSPRMQSSTIRLLSRQHSLHWTFSPRHITI